MTLLQTSSISKLLFYFHINLSHSYTRGHLNTTFIADQVIGTGTGSNWGGGGVKGGELKGSDGRGIFILTCLP